MQMLCTVAVDIINNIASIAMYIKLCILLFTILNKIANLIGNDSRNLNLQQFIIIILYSFQILK